MESNAIHLDQGGWGSRPLERKSWEASAEVQVTGDEGLNQEMAAGREERINRGEVAMPLG